MFELHAPAEYEDMSYGREETEFRAAAVLVASLVECGPDEGAIADLLGYDEAWVRSVGEGFREQGIWRSEGVALERVRGSGRLLGREWWRGFAESTGQPDGDPAPDVIRWPKRLGETSGSRRDRRRR